MPNKTIKHKPESLTSTMIVKMKDFKSDSDEDGAFTCYGSVKNIIDWAGDRVVDGAFKNSIARHLKAGTMPKMLWMHKQTDLPVGTWQGMVEDSIGLFMKGKMSKTEKGQDIRTLALELALDSFSIGFYILDWKWNETLECLDILEIDIFEVSWVNFACCEPSKLVNIKSKISGGGLPSKKELKKYLMESGLSTRESQKIAHCYSPTEKAKDIPENIFLDISSLMTKSDIPL